MEELFIQIKTAKMTPATTKIITSLANVIKELRDQVKDQQQKINSLTDQTETSNSPAMAVEQKKEPQKTKLAPTSELILSNMQPDKTYDVYSLVNLTEKSISAVSKNVRNLVNRGLIESKDYRGGIEKYQLTPEGLAQKKQLPE